jgi:predicted NUDIX family NTP pyrophosphohydrolase/dienelactone hydrolase
MAARRSAGILLFRRRGGALQVLLVHPGGPFWARRDEGAWSIPKGEYEEGEAPRAAALREFEEEIGRPVPVRGAVGARRARPGLASEAEPEAEPASEPELIELGSLRQPGGKLVTAWAAEGDLDAGSIVSNMFELEWPPRSGRLQRYPEVDRGEWFTLPEARTKILRGQLGLIDALAGNRVEVAVRIPLVEAAWLDGDLTLPASARTVVVFAHGSGSSRRSPRNLAVARVLQEAGVGTLMLDLLTEREDQADAVTAAAYRFDIGLLAGRVVAAIDWLDGHPDTAGWQLGLFGASTGAAAALVAAAERPDRVSAVVSRGGRPDLAGDVLERVRAPVLLIVGGRDAQVLQLNREAAERLRAPHRIEVVPGATHLFVELGALERVATDSRDWFLRPEPDRDGNR